MLNTLCISAQAWQSSFARLCSKFSGEPWSAFISSFHHFNSNIFSTSTYSASMPEKQKSPHFKVPSGGGTSAVWKVEVTRHFKHKSGGVQVCPTQLYFRTFNCWKGCFAWCSGKVESNNCQLLDWAPVADRNFIIFIISYKISYFSLVFFCFFCPQSSIPSF